MKQDRITVKIHSDETGGFRATVTSTTREGILHISKRFGSMENCKQETEVWCLDNLLAKPEQIKFRMD